MSEPIGVCFLCRSDGIEGSSVSTISVATCSLQGNFDRSRSTSPIIQFPGPPRSVAKAITAVTKISFVSNCRMNGGIITTNKRRMKRNVRFVYLRVDEERKGTIRIVYLGREHDPRCSNRNRIRYFPESQNFSFWRVRPIQNIGN